MNRSAGVLTVLVLLNALTTPSMSASKNSQSRQNAGARSVLPQLREDEDWSLLLPTDKLVVFHGVVSYDNAGGSTNSMMYPAPNAVGLLAAILTHAAINQSVRSAEKAKIQKAADAVVTPYASSIANYSYTQLFAAGLPKVSGIKLPILVEPGSKPSTKWVAESLPAYFMVQSGEAIWIENILALYDSEAKKKETHFMTVKVLSRDRIDMSAHPNHWSDGDGRELKAAFERLLAESVELARQELTQTLAVEESQYETVRYMEGNVQRMERGKILQRNCERVVLRTLRGWIMSVPRLFRTDEAGSKETATDAVCTAENNLTPSEQVDSKDEVSART